MDEDAIDAQISRHTAGHLTAGTAERAQQMCGGVESLALRDVADRTTHRLVRHANEAQCDLLLRDQTVLLAALVVHTIRVDLVSESGGEIRELLRFTSFAR